MGSGLNLKIRTGRASPACCKPLPGTARHPCHIRTSDVEHSSGSQKCVGSCHPPLLSYAEGLSEFTHILERAERGESQAVAELLPLVYDELRQLAAQKMAREAAGHTLQPTALVHEAWLRLGGKDAPTFQNRAHFFGAAAEAMRRILIEHARRRLAVKRGSGVEAVVLDGLEISSPLADDDR